MSLSLRDRLIPWYIVLFFVVIAVVDGIMVTIAIRTQPGVVTDHPYEKGIAYNNVIKEAEDQASLNWKGDIDYNSKTSVISFSLHDTSGKLIIADNVTANITRPTKQGMDFDIELSQSPDGVFQKEVAFPVKGLWELRVYAEASGRTYQQSKRINVE